jgi:hypothetical protein
VGQRGQLPEQLVKKSRGNRTPSFAVDTVRIENEPACGTGQPETGSLPPMKYGSIQRTLAALFFLAACDDETASDLITSVDGAAAGVQVDAASSSRADASEGVDAPFDAPFIADAVAVVDASSKDASGDAPLAPGEVVGYYSGQWGNMVLRLVGDEIWGAYTHDQGTIVGRYVDGVLVGWWSEVPSRLPTADAGDVEFRFTRVGNVVRMDGRWRYGTEQAWREDWDIDQVNAAPPADLLQRFDTPAVFIRHP